MSAGVTFSFADTSDSDEKVVTVHEVEEVPGSATLQVISIDEGPFGTAYYVRLKDGDECEDTPFEDYPQAYAHWRNVLRQLGIEIAYQAPQPVVSSTPAAPARTWIEVFYDFHAQLSIHKAGDPGATAVRDAFMANPEFRENVSEILFHCDDRQDWVSATIRVACRRVMRQEKIEAETVMKDQLGALPTFGAF